MNVKKIINLGNLSVIIQIAAIGLLVYLILDLRSTERNLAESLINKSMNGAKLIVGDYYADAEKTIDIIKEQASLGLIIERSLDQKNRFLYPIMDNNPYLKYFVSVDSQDDEFGFYLDDGKVINRERWYKKWGNTSIYKKWDLDTLTYSWKLQDEWEVEESIDPKSRPWYIGAMGIEVDKSYWSDPYKFEATGELGMTVSRKWKHPDSDGYNVLAFGIVLTKISEYTQKIKVSPNGKVFILSKEGKYIGLPQSEKLTTVEEIKANLLKHVDSTDLKVQAQAYNYWINEHDQSELSFKHKTADRNMWSNIVKFYISDDNYVLIGTNVPEDDILSELRHTKRIVIGGFVFILIITSFLLYSYNQTKKANIILDAKNIEISNKNEIIEEKNKDILDSLNYASRLQFAMLPSQEILKECLKNYFVLFKPKDVVAGDFYWMEKKDESLYVTAADCTGHGVPGAMVSVVCINALNRSILEFNLTDPGQILDKTREIVIKEFDKSSEDVNDGMDIAFISLNGNTLKYAGAYNPLWIIRDGELLETKANKQPIGSYENPQLFTTHTIECQAGDTLYMFSDGFADQFGGEKGKKLKSKPFKEMLLKIQDKSMEEQGKFLEKEFNAWKGSYDQIDDVLVLGIKI